MIKTTTFITFLLLAVQLHVQAAAGNPSGPTQLGVSVPVLKERVLSALEKIVLIREAQLRKAKSEALGKSRDNLFPALRYALRNSIKEYNNLKNSREPGCRRLRAVFLTTESMLNQLKNQ